MDASIPMLVNVATAGLLIVVAVGAERAALTRSAIVAILLDAGVLTAFVFGEDTYRRGGISRWDAYRSPGGALGLMFVASVVALLVVAVVLVYAEARRFPRLVQAATLGGTACALFLIIPTIIGFSTN